MFASINTPSGARIAALALSAFFFTGCFMAAEEAEDRHDARLTVQVKVGASESLSKSQAGAASAAAPRMMLVTLVSSERDTLRDTVTAAGSRLSLEPTNLSPVATLAQSVITVYKVAPRRSWKVSVRVLDMQDSLRHSDSSQVSALDPLERRTVSLSLLSRFASYDARFALPSEIPVVEAGAVRARQVYFTRLALSIDGKPVADSAVASIGAYRAGDAARLAGSAGKRFFKPSFAGSSEIVLSNDHVQPGSRNFVLSAYGYLEGDTVGVTPVRLLYQGDRNVTAALGKAVTDEAVALDWKAGAAASPSSDAVGLTVKIGKMGTIVMNVTMSGAIDI